ncbi:MAG: hypothetical protein IJR45_00370 [Firmicutes bacterium]|nr:hypothetical protein [Bacillota bacterium]
MRKLYTRIVNIQKLIWKIDDILDQNDLFDLQEKIADLALAIAENENKTDDLVEKFPWLYTKN